MCWDDSTFFCDESINVDVVSDIEWVLEVSGASGFGVFVVIDGSNSEGLGISSIRVVINLNIVGGSLNGSKLALSDKDGGFKYEVEYAFLAGGSRLRTDVEEKGFVVKAFGSAFHDGV